MKINPETYYVWIGGSCDYAHKERASAGACIIEHDGKTIDTWTCSAPGFNRYIEFPDYSATDLLKIFNLQLAHHDYRLIATASTRAMEIIEAALAAKSSSFGNARYVRNLFERTIENQAVRLAEKPSVTREELLTIEDVDIQ